MTTVARRDPADKAKIEASWVEFRFFYGPVLMGWVR